MYIYFKMFYYLLKKTSHNDITSCSVYFWMLTSRGMIAVFLGTVACPLTKFTVVWIWASRGTCGSIVSFHTPWNETSLNWWFLNYIFYGTNVTKLVTKYMYTYMNRCKKIKVLNTLYYATIFSALLHSIRVMRFYIFN